MTDLIVRFIMDNVNHTQKRFIEVSIASGLTAGLLISFIPLFGKLLWPLTSIVVGIYMYLKLYNYHLDIKIIDEKNNNKKNIII